MIEVLSWAMLPFDAEDYGKVAIETAELPEA
jgi:hypothetical protein